jgi:putative DNA primase/helicase
MHARDITTSLGGTWASSYGLARCPCHADSTPSLKIREDERKADGIDVHCFAGCRWQDIKAELAQRGLLSSFDPRHVPLTPFPRLSEISGKHENDDRIELARKIWRAATPLSGSLGERYLLEHRQLEIGTVDLEHVVRWHDGFCAIVAMMTDAVTGEPTGIHRTFLTDDGRKRERKMLGRQGVIRLSPDEDVTQGLGICEGIEDALAVILSGWRPVWAATSCGAIERLPVLSGVESLTIFADNDKAGLRAAETCAPRWIEAGREASVMTP